MPPLTLTSKSREAFLADRFAIQPEEVVSVYANELSCLLISEETLRRKTENMQREIDMLKTLLAVKSQPMQHIKLYA